MSYTARIALSEQAHEALNELPNWVNKPRFLAAALQLDRDTVYPVTSVRRVPLPHTQKVSSIVIEAVRQIQEFNIGALQHASTPEFSVKQADEIPDRLRAGVLYVSEKYQTVGHLCPCGCGEDVFISTREHGWKLTMRDGKVTLSPSLAHRFKCKSHYFIEDNKVRWCK